MLLNKACSITIVLLFCIALNACKKSGTNQETPTSLTISSLSVNAGPYNTTVVITGTGFSSTLAADQVNFNGKAATITAATTTNLTAIVPKGAGTGNVTVAANGSQVSGPIFTYQLSATVSTFAGNDNIGTIDGTGINASFKNPFSIATDKSGNIYVADQADNVVRKITSAGVVTTLAGNGKQGSSNGPGNQASFNSPYGLVADASGNIFVADHGNATIRKITQAGNVTTFAGNGSFVEADGLGTNASFAGVYGITIDTSGNLYVIAGSIRKITPAGVVNTIQGTAGVSNISTGIVVDANGNIYLSGGQSYNIKKITPSGVISVLAGSGQKGSTNGIGTSASFSFLCGIAQDNSGNLLVTDNYNSQIRMVKPDGVVSTLAGVLNGGYPTFDGQGNLASFYSLSGIAVDPSGTIYVSEANNHRIRKIVME